MTVARLSVEPVWLLVLVGLLGLGLVAAVLASRSQSRGWRDIAILALALAGAIVVIGTVATWLGRAGPGL